MAEAAVDSAPCASLFFCHECQTEVQPNIPAYTCSRCNSGFIEEVENSPAPAQSLRNADTSDPAAMFAEMVEVLYDPMRHGGNIGSLLGPRHRYNTRLASTQANRTVEQNLYEDSDEDLRVVTPSAVFHLNTGDRQQGQQAFQGIVNYVIQRLGSDLGGRGHFVHLHGNPGDYAWGSGGLDAIISQLLNQLEGTGAPPAQKDTIDNLPQVCIEQSHIDLQLQCSICMDDFEMNQQVKKLPCDHLYHSECIIRWLEMHGTCPVCRKDLNGADTSTDETNFATIFPSASSTSSSSSSSSMDPSSSSSFSMDFEHNQ